MTTRSLRSFCSVESDLTVEERGGEMEGRGEGEEARKNRCAASIAHLVASSPFRSFVTNFGMPTLRGEFRFNNTWLNDHVAENDASGPFTRYI
ncbi:hypothetical protein NPIL_214011 [Nephila pilipes]|uniref:Uncharacterized protein n=1 Tax=Nephila pilipes TaxID=299642 RepID=A0A8X6P510_NEPPI|nr:hypothetical protein NPIL_214011 [Nephila pilipes]